MKKPIPVIPVQQLDECYQSIPVRCYDNQELLARPLFCSSTHASFHFHPHH